MDYVTSEHIGDAGLDDGKAVAGSRGGLVSRCLHFHPLHLCWLQHLGEVGVSTSSSTIDVRLMSSDAFRFSLAAIPRVLCAYFWCVLSPSVASEE